MPSSYSIQCPTCHSPIDITETTSTLPAESICRNCSSVLEVYAFGALYRIDKGKPAEAIGLDTEASCFYHAQKKAVMSCASCGRFLCSLCDMELSGRHLCPKCIESAREKKKLTDLENRRVLYDDIALSVAILPIITVYFTILTAPVVIYLTFRYWNSPGSILPRTKIRFVIAIFFAVLEIAGWAVVGYFIARAWRPA